MTLNTKCYMPENWSLVFTSSAKREKKGVSRCRRATTAKKCTKMRDARAKLLFCQSKPINFLPSLLLKFSNLSNVKDGKNEPIMYR